MAREFAEVFKSNMEELMYWLPREKGNHTLGAYMRKVLKIEEVPAGENITWDYAFPINPAVELGVLASMGYRDVLTIYFDQEAGPFTSFEIEKVTKEKGLKGFQVMKKLEL